MSNWLKQSIATTVQFGPFVYKGDAVTLQTGLVSALDHASTGIMISKNGGTKAVRSSSTASVYDAHGDYKVSLNATDTNTAGGLRLSFTDANSILPVFKDFLVLPANVWDSMVGGTDYLQVDQYQTFGNTLDAATGTNFKKEYDGRGFGSIVGMGTIATSVNATSFTSTTSFLSERNNSYVGSTIIFRSTVAGADGGYATSKRLITSYTYSSGTRTITFDSALDFTGVAGIQFEIVDNSFGELDRGYISTTSTRVLLALPAAAPSANGGLPTVNGSNLIAGLQGTLQTLDALDTSQTTQHSLTRTRLPAALSSDGFMKSDVYKFEGIDPTDEITLLITNALDGAEVEISEDTLTALAAELWGMLQVDVEADTMGEAVTDILAVAVKIASAMVADGLVWKFTANALEDAPNTEEDVTANLLRASILYGPTLSMVDFSGRTGLSEINGVLINSQNKVWNTSTNSFDTLLDSIAWADAIIPMTEVPGGDATGLAIYRATMPSVTIGNYTVLVQDGIDQSAERLLHEMIFWDGQSVVPTSGVLATTYNAIRTTTNLGTGSLSKTITIVAHNGNPVPGVSVFVTLDSDGQEEIAGPLLTDDYGKVTFMLNPGTYYAWGNGLNTNIVNPKTFNVP